MGLSSQKGQEEDSEVQNRVAFLSKVTKLVRDISLNQMKQYVGNEQVSLADYDLNRELNYDHWIIGIVIKSNVINITFRVHFSSMVARKFAQEGLKIKADEITPLISQDYIQEYTNLTVGSIKRHLLEGGLSGRDFDMNSQVPYAAPSYDQIDIKGELENGKIQDCWMLSLSCGDFICASKVHVINWEEVFKLEDLNVSVFSVSEDGDIEFF